MPESLFGDKKSLFYRKSFVIIRETYMYIYILELRKESV